MSNATLADNDFLALLMTGLLLLSLALLPLSIGFTVGPNPRLVIFSLGGLFTGTAVTLGFKRRNRLSQELRILEILYENGAIPGDRGIQPYLIQDHLGSRTDMFEGYVRDLLNKHFINWGDPKKLLITQDGLDLLSNIKMIEVVARFLRETTSE